MKAKTINEILFEAAFADTVIKRIQQLFIPLNKNVSNILYGDKKINTFHISDMFHIEDMKNLIGSDKSISTFTYISKGKLRTIEGVRTLGGVIYQIEGNILFYSTVDAGTLPDFNGLRWINPFILLDRSISNNWEQIAGNLSSQYKFQEIVTDQTKKKELTEFIKIYFKTAEKFVTDNKESFLNKLSFLVPNTWNELVVNKIAIKDILWSDQEPIKIFNKIKEKKQNNTKLSAKEEYILNNYQEWLGKIQKKLESISSGKVYTTKQITPIDFVKNRGGITDNSKYKNPLE